MGVLGIPLVPPPYRSVRLSVRALCPSLLCALRRASVDCLPWLSYPLARVELSHGRRSEGSTVTLALAEYTLQLQLPQSHTFPVAAALTAPVT